MKSVIAVIALAACGSAESRPPGEMCSSTAFETSNDTFATAQAIAPGELGPAAQCNDDVDYYAFDVPANTDVTVEIHFVSGAGVDLDLELLGPSGDRVAISQGFGSLEHIMCPSTRPLCANLAAGRYTAVVTSSLDDNDPTQYTLSLVLE